MRVVGQWRRFKKRLKLDFMEGHSETMRRGRVSLDFRELEEETELKL